MALVSKNIDSYQVSYISDAGFTTGSVNACEVNCFKSNTQVARICFLKAGLSLPANAVNGGVLYLYFPLSQFGDIIGILRYDKALVLYLDTSSNVGGIGGEYDALGKKP